jgi:hypothetical protein
MADSDLTVQLREALAASMALGDDSGARALLLRSLVHDGLASLPLPGAGATLERWRALAAVAAHDLALVKLYEGHTDALAILAEAGEPAPPRDTLFGMWAAESPGARVTFEAESDGECNLSGTKAWCSGARHIDWGLLTVWQTDGSGPFLACVDLDQPGVFFDDAKWQAVGMRASDSVDVRFDRVPARLVGGERFYLTRPGFWHGGIGIAACWHGGACAIAEALRRNAASAGDKAGWHRWMALGDVDRVLSSNAALLREAARWIDDHPHDDAQTWALRTRVASDAACGQALHHATRALGATPLCRDAAFARLAADLPVFVRQCHGERDLATLGERVVASAEDTPWLL